MNARTEAVAGSAGEPSRSIEIELKFDVDADTPVPDFSSVPGVASVTEGEVRDLDARYLDTAEFALASAGYALRRRTGGPDAGWHIKGPRVGDARVELQWALGAEFADDDAVPEGALAALAEVTDAVLSPLARIRNARTAYALLDEEGGMIAEFADDRVITLDERSGATREWREWEMELGPAASIEPGERAVFFAAVQEIVLTAGGRPASSASKLARALGY